MGRTYLNLTESLIPSTTLVSLPSSPGTYALILRLDRPTVLQVGCLGEFFFTAGDFVYLGNAFGPGGLKARLGRHLRGGARSHWHIDTLREVARVTGFCYTLGPSPLECCWTQRLSNDPGAWFPAPGFGASDCRGRPARCPAHLLAFSRAISAQALSNALGEPGNLPVHSMIQR